MHVLTIMHVGVCISEHEHKLALQVVYPDSQDLRFSGARHSLKQLLVRYTPQFPGESTHQLSNQRYQTHDRISTILIT